MLDHTPASFESVADFITRRLATLGKSAQHLVDDCGLINFRVATSIMTGRVKVPLKYLESIAGSIGVPADELRRRILKEYFPELVAAASTKAAPALNASPISGDIPIEETGYVTSSALVRMPEKRQLLRASDSLHLPSLRIRLLFRALPNGFTTEQAARHLLLRPHEAEWLLQELADLDYIVQTKVGAGDSKLWTLLPDALQLADAEIPAPLKKAAAMQVVSEFLEQVAKVNQRDGLAYRVAGVNLIGELVTAAARQDIPHVELVVIVANKSDDPSEQQALMTAAMEQCRARVAAEGHPDWKPTERAVQLDFQGLLRHCGLPVALRWFYDAPGTSRRA